MESNTPQRISTAERLATALKDAGAPHKMVQLAYKNHYDDYKSELAFPIVELVQDAQRAGLDAIVHRAQMGEFDSQAWEADEWVQSLEGQETLDQWGEELIPARTMNRLLKGKKPRA